MSQIQSDFSPTSDATAHCAPAGGGGSGRHGGRAGGAAAEERGGNVEGVRVAVGEMQPVGGREVGRGSGWRGGGEGSGRGLLVDDDDDVYFGVRPDFSGGRQTLEGFHRALGSENFNGTEGL